MNFISASDFSMGIPHKGSPRSLHLGFLSFLLALTSNCMPTNHEMATLASVDSNSALVDRTIESEKPVDVKLDSIKDDPIGKTIVYQAFERSEKANREVQYGPNEMDHPNTIPMEGSPSTVTLVIKFPQLSLEQFNFLKNHYGQGASKVIFKSGEIYTLPDFFQPPIQALHSKYHLTRIGYKNDSVCWATAFETASFNPKRFSFYVNNANQMLDILDNNPQVQKIPNRDSLKPGDMMVYWTANENKRDIPHAYVYLDKGILFEKENRGPNNFRMYYNAGALNDKADDLKLAIYRFNHNSPLKGTDIFGNEKGNTPLIFVSSPYVFDDLGRASLSLPEESGATTTNNPINPSGTNSNTNTNTNISNTSPLPANPGGTSEVLPAMTEGCDYTDAGKPENKGYGYNPNLQKSCAPKSS